MPPRDIGYRGFEFRLRTRIRPGVLEPRPTKKERRRMLGRVSWYQDGGEETLNSGKKQENVGKTLAILTVDDRYRVLLDKEVRVFLKIAPGDKVLAIPSSEGVLITSLKGKRFKTSLSGFRFKEESHEASRYLFKKN